MCLCPLLHGFPVGRSRSICETCCGKVSVKAIHARCLNVGQLAFLQCQTNKKTVVLGITHTYLSPGSKQLRPLGRFDQIRIIDKEKRFAVRTVKSRVITISIHYILNILPHRLRAASIKRLYMKAHLCPYFCSLIQQERHTLVAIIAFSPPSDRQYADIRFYMHPDMFPDDFRIIAAVRSEFRIKITGDVIIKSGYGTDISRMSRSKGYRVHPVLHFSIH